MTNDFDKRFKNASVADLVSAFNNDVGNPGWVTARGFYHAALQRALLASGVDCSLITDGNTMRFNRRIEVKSGRYVPTSEESQNPEPICARASTEGQLASAYFRRIDADTWFIIGSGASYGDGIETNQKFASVLEALEAGGIAVTIQSHGFPGSCDSFVFSADFEGGSLRVETGNYFGRSGGTVKGANALKRLIELLRLKLPSQTARRWELA
jgi:hypothetical protein